MKYKSFDTYELEEGEPCLRSCPECNPAHKHLMDTDYFHTCFQCGRSWIFGRYLDSFKSDKEMDDFLKEKLTKFKKHKPYVTILGFKKEAHHDKTKS